VNVKNKCLTMMNTIDYMAQSYITGDGNNHCGENSSTTFKDSHRPIQRSQLLLRYPTDLHIPLRCSNTSQSDSSYLIVAWIPLHNSRCFQGQRRVLLHHPSVFDPAAVGCWNIRNHWGVLVRLAVVFAMLLGGFWTISPFVDIHARLTSWHPLCVWTQKSIHSI